MTGREPACAVLGHGMRCEECVADVGEIVIDGGCFYFILSDVAQK